MKTSTLHLHTKHQIGQVDPRIFGGFLEHMGRAVYEGVYDPESIHVNEHGYRQDVLQALSQLNMTTMRYPGGNFASGYHWQDGVGPRALRPIVRELAWQSMEPNRFGTDEYIHLCRQMDWIPMVTVNLGTGTPEEARNWVEYCNSPAGTRFADLRASNGSEVPYGVKLWCLGNEMDGPWQLGHVPASQYAIRAQQTAKMMKLTDPSIELVACGSSSVDMPTYIEWDLEVLGYVADLADYISLHRYVGNHTGNTLDYLAVANSIDRQIEDVDAVCRAIQAKNRGKKRTYLCFDEWNIWYRTHTPKDMDGQSTFAPHLIEEVYNLEDALVVAGILHSFIRHADVLKIANLAQIVNVIAPILTREDEILIQSIFYPFAMFSQRRQGTSLQIAMDGPGYESPSYGYTAFIDASAILGDDQLHVFLTNRDPVEAAEIKIRLADHSLGGFSAGEVLHGIDSMAANSYEHPFVVQSEPFHDVRISAEGADVLLPPLAFAALTISLSA